MLVEFIQPLLSWLGIGLVPFFLLIIIIVLVVRG